MNIDNKTLYRWIRVALRVLVILVVVYATLTLSFTAYDFGYRIFTESPIDAKPGVNVEITIDKGMDAKEIGSLLEKKGLIRDANLFVLQYKLSAYSGEIVAGTYTLNTSETAKEMMIIMSGQTEDLEE